MKNASNVFKELSEMVFIKEKKPESAQLAHINKAIKWCDTYGFTKDHPHRADFINSFCCGAGIGECLPFKATTKEKD